VTPNPARSPKVKLPERVKEEIAPPASDEWRAIRASLPKRLLLVSRFIECEAVRVSEALSLTYGDIDFAKVASASVAPGRREGPQASDGYPSPMNS
jgi:integrase